MLSTLVKSLERISSRDSFFNEVHCFIAFASLAICSLDNATSQVVRPDHFPEMTDQMLLRRGVNITRWWSAEQSKKASFYEGYLPLHFEDQLVSMGVTFVRVPVSPVAIGWDDEHLDREKIDLLGREVMRLERKGLAVIISPIRHHMDLETERDRYRLVGLWKELILTLRVDYRLTYFETLNEPHFAKSEDWNELQSKIIGVMRDVCKDSKIVVTGNDWGSINGLIALTPSPRPGIVYGFHFYDPAFLTTMHDEFDLKSRGQLDKVPFPVEPGSCLPKDGEKSEFRRMLIYYCNSRWSYARVNADIGRVEQWAHDHRVMIVNTEFGIRGDRNAPTRLAYLRAVRNAFERRGIGWGLWGYDDAFGLGINMSSRPLANPDPEVLRALGLRP